LKSELKPEFGLLRIAIFEKHITIGGAMATQVKVLLVFLGLLNKVKFAYLNNERGQI
jgi:hypothetical protein